MASSYPRPARPLRARLVAARRALAAPVLVALSGLFYLSLATLVSCGSETSSGDFSPANQDGSSGGGDDASVGTDSGAGGEGGLGFVRDLVVHASPDTRDFRVCFGTVADPDGGTTPTLLKIAPFPSDPSHPMPRANYPGVPAGGGLLLDADLSSAGPYLVPYLVDAETLATKTTLANKTCDQIFCGSGAGCLKAEDYDTLPPIPTGALAAPGARLLVVSGCHASTAAPERCGFDYVAGTSNLAMRVVSLDAHPLVADNQLGVQVAHFAPVLGSVLARYGAADAGTPLGTVDVGEAGAQTAGHVTLPANDPAFGSTSITLAPVNDAGPTGTEYPFSLAQIQTATDPTTVPGDFFNGGRGYVFVVVGDPAYPQADGGPSDPDYLAHGLHVIALPTTPPTLDAGPL